MGVSNGLVASTPTETSSVEVDTNPALNGSSPPQETSESLAAMKKAAHQKFSEATKARQEAESFRNEGKRLREEALISKAEMEQFIDLSQKDPKALEKIYGRDVAKKIAEDLLYGMFEDEKLSPEQREARAKKASEDDELEGYRADKKNREEKETAETRAKLVNDQAVKLDQDITGAIKEYGLTATPIVVKRIARYLEAQLESDMELDVSQVIPKVHEEIHGEVVAYFKDMPIEQMIEEFPTLVKRVREFDMKQVSKVPSFQSGFAKPESDAKAKEPVKKDSFEERFRRIGT